jgi:hypothetical protein
VIHDRALTRDTQAGSVSSDRDDINIKIRSETAVEAQFLPA